MGGDLVGWDGVTQTRTPPSPLERCCLPTRCSWGCWARMMVYKIHGPGWGGTPQPGWRLQDGTPEPSWGPRMGPPARLAGMGFLAQTACLPSSAL